MNRIVSIRSSHKSKGRPMAPSTVEFDLASFNPLLSQKQGETPTI